MGKLKAGDKAPDFHLKDQQGNEVKLSAFKGRKLLLYFYPKANTPGCATQACSVRDASAQLSDLGLAAIGVSPDQPKAQKNFDDKFGLGFPLLSDPDHKAADAYGVWGEKSRFGKKYEGIIRSSFLIDENGKLLQTWYKVSPEETIPKALEALKQ